MRLDAVVVVLLVALCCGQAQETAQSSGGSGSGDTGVTPLPEDSTGGAEYPTAEPDGNTSGDTTTCKDTCTANEKGEWYALPGCTNYCVCAPKTTNTDNSTGYYYQFMPCPPETLFDIISGVCGHAEDVECIAQSGGGSGSGDTGVTPLPEESTGGPDYPTTEPDGSSSGDTESCKDACALSEHGYKYALPGCTKYCKCAPKTTNTDSSTEYYWQIMPCPDTTLFDNTLGICNYAHEVECDAQSGGGSGSGDTGVTPLPEESTGGPDYPTAEPDGSTSGDTESCKDACASTEHGDKYALPGCTNYCKCAPKTTNTDSSTEYYWQIMPCPDTTLFDNTLGICNYAKDVECDAMPDDGSGPGKTDPTAEPDDSTDKPDPNDSGSGDTPDDDKDAVDLSDATDAISKFLGFKCPKGYRCLPVLECIPCEYGQYKSTETSDLCKLCPAGCTTLRKGAKSWKECVPKCPPGYEESECGKTCTKCRPGYFKSSWKNVKCHKCPSRSHPDSHTIGMKRMRECFAQGGWTTVTTPEPEQTTAVALTTVEPEPETTSEQTTTIKITTAPPETETTPEQTKTIEITTVQPAPETTSDGGVRGCDESLPCDHTTSSEDWYIGDVDCQGFCQCTTRSTVSFYWEHHDCAPGTLYNEQITNCDHTANVVCNPP